MNLSSDKNSGNMQSLRNIFGSFYQAQSFLSFNRFKVNGALVEIFNDGVRFRAGLCRRPIRVYEPQTKSQKEEINKHETPKTITQSSSVFNLTMGEITMSNNRKLIAVEGVRLVEDAIKCGLKLKKLFLTNNLKQLPSTFDHFLELENLEKSSNMERDIIHRISPKLMQTWSSVTTPPGIIGVFGKPKSTDIKARVDQINHSIPLTIICDNIREPGNLGSILRSAAGVGCKTVLLTKGCVDCWNMKVLRGASGAHFYIPVVPELVSNSIESHILEKLVKNNKLNSQSEAEEMPNSQTRVGIFLADNNLTDKRLEVPLLNYFDVDYNSFDHIFLTIGGETEGLGNEVLSIIKKISQNYSVVVSRVRIPLAYDMDSLNASNAFGIIAFEIHRQIKFQTKRINC